MEIRIFLHFLSLRRDRQLCLRGAEHQTLPGAPKGEPGFWDCSSTEGSKATPKKLHIINAEPKCCHQAMLSL